MATVFVVGDGKVAEAVSKCGHVVMYAWYPSIVEIERMSHCSHVVFAPTDREFDAVFGWYLGVCCCLDLPSWSFPDSQKRVFGSCVNTCTLSSEEDLIELIKGW